MHFLRNITNQLLFMLASIAFLTTLMWFVCWFLFERDARPEVVERKAVAEIVVADSTTSGKNGTEKVAKKKAMPIVGVHDKKPPFVSKKPSKKDSDFADHAVTPAEKRHITFETENQYADSRPENIDQQMAEHGNFFRANLQQIKYIPVGEPLLIEIAAVKMRGTVTGRKASSSIAGNLFVDINFDGTGRYMTAYISGGTIKGKIYTGREALMYEFNTEARAGYMLSIHKYKELNDALHVD